MNRLSKKKGSTFRKHLVYIQKNTQIADGEGGFTNGWANTSPERIWVGIAPIRAVQVAEYKSLNVDATHLVRAGGYVDIQEEYRFLFGTRVFEILTIENIQERDYERVITCKELRDKARP